MNATFLKALKVLSVTYPAWKVDEETVAVWAALLSDVQPEEVLRAAIEWCRTPSEFPPKPGEIRALAMKPEDAPLTAEEAWGQVMSEIRRVGWIGTPVWTSEAVKRAASALGSWRTLCSQTSDQLSANRAHFMRIYAAFAQKHGRMAEQNALAPIVDLMLGTGAKMLQDTKSMYGASKTELESEEYEERDLLAEEAKRLNDYELGADLDREV